MKKSFWFLLLLFPIGLLAQKPGVKKTPPKPPAKTQPPKKLSGPELSIIAMTIEHNGEKIELNNKQFETWGGTTIPNGTGKSIILNYGASNSKKNNESFSWMFTIPDAAKGTYTVGDKSDDVAVTTLMFNTTAFPKIQVFLCKSGSITIEDCPLAGGFVKGSFSVVLTGGVTSDGQLDESEYTLSGSFSILRL